MNVPGRINALVLIALLAASAVLSTYLIHQQYTSTRDQVLTRVHDELNTQLRLQMSIYYHDKAALAHSLDALQVSDAVHYAALYNSQGTLLAQSDARALSFQSQPSFDTLRIGLRPVEEGLLLRNIPTDSGAPGFFDSLGLDEQISDLTLPVFSLVNPYTSNLSRADFMAAIAQPDTAGSAHVIGYALIGISRNALLNATVPYAFMVLLSCLLFIVPVCLLCNLIVRRVTAPLTRLAAMADNISAGQLEQAMKVAETGEAREIADVLGSMIGDLKSYRTQMDVDHQLLSMKVEERTAQLSRRNKELNEAVREVTEAKDRLRKMAYFDSLTALPNRRLFTEQLHLLLKLTRRSEQTLALLFIDLDNFKRINDSLGHSVGDLILREVANRLSGCVRDSDVVAHYVDTSVRIDVSRLGGDEFTVVLNQIENAEAAGLVAQRLIDSLARPVQVDGHEIVITPSIGIAVAPHDADNVEGLLRAADTAMYHAKNGGKNHYLYYDSEMEASSVDRLMLESDLRKAVERNQLMLHYQPKVNTETGSVVGAEALLRWHHPEHGVIPPFKFIPLAEELGLIGELGSWVLETACNQLKSFHDEGFSLPKIAVNVSALQFNPGFSAHVGEVLERTGLSPSSLELELTEGVMMDSSASTVQALNDLKELGISLSIDDFGTGYSSLSYLSRFPLDELKIDRSFVTDVDKNQNDASLVVAIIAMAQSMNLQLVAEGVETAEQYQFLTNNGATIVQGYLFSKPVPAGELQHLLSPHHFHQQICELQAGRSGNRHALSDLAG